MIKISAEEVLHIASLSRIKLADHEIAQAIHDLEEALSYVARVQEIALQAEEVESKNVNVFRDDIVKPTPAEPLLHNAPKKEDQYFVVPVVLE